MKKREEHLEWTFRLSLPCTRYDSGYECEYDCEYDCGYDCEYDYSWKGRIVNMGELLENFQ